MAQTVVRFGIPPTDKPFASSHRRLDRMEVNRRSDRHPLPVMADLLARGRRLGDADDRPDKPDHLTGDCRGDHDLRLARRRQPAIARAQPGRPR